MWCCLKEKCCKKIYFVKYWQPNFLVNYSTSCMLAWLNTKELTKASLCFRIVTSWLDIRVEYIIWLYILVLFSNIIFYPAFPHSFHGRRCTTALQNPKDHEANDHQHSVRCIGTALEENHSSLLLSVDSSTI